jgi:hypothetical protein
MQFDQCIIGTILYGSNQEEKQQAIQENLIKKKERLEAAAAGIPQEHSLTEFLFRDRVLTKLIEEQKSEVQFKPLTIPSHDQK